MMEADNLNSERVICRGIVRLKDAAKGCGDIKEGLVDR